MKSLRYFALVGILVVPFAMAHAAVGVGIGIGVGPGYVAAPPVCTYGYYPYYPYACAPYGYYGPEWFVGGGFIGAGPWYHGWGHPFRDHGVYRPGFWGHGSAGYHGRGFVGPGGFRGRGPAPIVHGGGFRGGEAFHGGGSFHGGGGFHGGGSHGR